MCKTNFLVLLFTFFSFTSFAVKDIEHQDLFRSTSSAKDNSKKRVREEKQTTLDAHIQKGFDISDKESTRLFKKPRQMTIDSYMGAKNITSPFELSKEMEAVSAKIIPVERLTNTKTQIVKTDRAAASKTLTDTKLDARPSRGFEIPKKTLWAPGPTKLSFEPNTQIVNIPLVPHHTSIERPLVPETVQNQDQPHIFKKRSEPLFLDCKMIYGASEHSENLLRAIRGAQESIEITSYGKIFVVKEEQQDLFKALRDASKRGVKIYLRSNEPSEEDFHEKPWFEPLRSIKGLNYKQFDNHTKLVIVDKRKVLSGSFNYLDGFKRNCLEYGTQDSIHDLDRWLDQTDSNVVEDVSLQLEGEASELLAKRLSHYIGQYRRITQEDDYLEEFKKKYSDPLYQYEIFKVPGDEKSFNEIAFLATPYQHKKFMQDAFNLAKSRIEIHSPFVSENWESLKNRMSRDTVKAFLNKGKKLVIVHLDKEKYKSTLRKHLEPLKLHKNLRTITRPEMHQKLFVLDDHTLAISSFNFLSAYMDIDPSRPDKNPFNTTVVLRGSEARKIIDKLRQVKILETF